MMARQDRLTALLEMGAIEEFEAELSAYAAVAESVRRPHDLWRSALMHATISLFRGDMEPGTRLDPRAVRGHITRDLYDELLEGD